MPCLRFTGHVALSGLVIALLSAAAQAAPVECQAIPTTPCQNAGVLTHIGAQAPKSDLSSPAPPVPVGAAADALAAFAGELDRLGGNEFEPSVATPAVPASLNFTYGANGAASAVFSGNASLISGSDADPLLGRYNMSPDVQPGLDGSVPGPGNWVEASANFEVSFSQAISAFSFFTTDLGDYDGVFIVDLLDAAGNVVLSQDLANREIGNQVDSPGTASRVTGNGNLLFVGITSSDPAQTFSKAVFRISQCTLGVNGCDGETDVLGFDSFVVGNYKNPNGTGGTPIPEPASLALVGMGLLAAPMTPAGFGDFIKSEIANYARIIKAANIKLD